MTKETQDLTWRCLPKEVREEIREKYSLPNTNDWEHGRACTYVEIFGKHNLTSDEEPSVQDEPKFKVGDKVRYISQNHEIGEIAAYWPDEKFCYSVRFGKEYHNMAEHQLEPYTEPETKMKTLNESLPEASKIIEDNFWDLTGNSETKDNMEEKELNLCELLKDAIGEEIYSPTFGVVKVTMANCNCIGVDPWNHNSKSFNINGKYVNKADAVVSLFPSRTLYEKYPLDAYSAWMEWRSERTPKRWRAEESEFYYRIDTYFEAREETEWHLSSHDNILYEIGNYFRTKEEAEQAAEAVRECLAKIHEKISAQNLHNPK